MPFFDPIRIGASGVADTAFTVDRSLRFNDDDSAYLNRTPSSSSNRKTFTISWWFKRGNQGTIQAFFGAYDNSTSGNDSYYFSCIISDQGINLGAWNQNWLKTNRLFRDPSAWYHCVLAYDTTQSTADNRVRMYINGVEETSFAQRNNPSQNFDLGWNFSSQMQTIGRVNYTSGTGPYPFDGYIAEFNSIDGLALDASYFGETDSITGQWIPKQYTGSYGTNGFYLNFSDNSGTTATTLGKDSSGNGNNFTPNNFTVTAGAGNDSVEDTPTNNFPTLNPLNINPYSSSGYPSPTFTNGNLEWTTNTTSQVNYAESTMYFPISGKWYMEVKVDNLNIGNGVGYTQLSVSGNTGGSRYLWWVYSSPYYQINTNSGTQTIGSIADGDVIQIAYDSDTGNVWFGKNNSWYLSGDPANGTAMSPATTVTNDFARFSVAGRSGSEANIVDVNFGQQAFSYTPPTGFKAVNSGNLPNPTILLPDRHFDTFTYSGDGNSTQTLSNVLEFQPDWVWLKGSNTNYSHTLYDSRRGAGSLKGLNSNETRPEGSTVQDDSTFGFLSSFDANGITVTKGSDSTSYTNGASSEYVAWNWLAGGADSKTYKVKVVADSTDYGHGTGSNKYQFFKSDGTTGFGTNAVDLDLEEGGTYVFDWSDSSAQSHPIRFSLTNDGTHSNGTSAGTEYTTGVTKDDSAYKTTITIASGVANLFYYCQNHSGMGAEINTNTTKGSTNFDGSLLSVVKANTTAGFSITSFTVSSSAAYTVGHGLGVAPRVIIMKSRTQTFNWDVFHASVGNTKRIRLNDNTAPEDYTGPWNDTDPTSTVFSSVGSWLNNSSDQIAYIFSEVDGYSKFGSYTGNGSTDGTFVFIGFRPAFVIQRRTDSSGHWYIFDNKRAGFNVDNKSLSPDLSASQYTVTVIDFLSNGFKLRSNAVAHNASGGTYLYIAFAESPFKNARAR